MDSIKKLLNNTYGYTLVGLLLVITIFLISIVPIYKMVINGAKIQRVAEQTYEATLQAQSLLQSVKKQIEADVRAEYSLSRGLPSPGVRFWLKPGIINLDSSLVNFLDIEADSIDEKFNMDTFLYEVHIWHMVEGTLGDKAISFTTYNDPSLIPEFNKENTFAFTKVEIEDTAKQYFSHKGSLEWTDFGESKPVAIGEITYGADGLIRIKGNGIKGENIGIEPINGYSILNNKLKLIYETHIELLENETNITEGLIIEDSGGISKTDDIVQLSIDLTTFPNEIKSKTIRIENKTKAMIVIPVYNEKNFEDIKIYPIQQNPEGNIIVENRNKLEPSKNFVIGVIVRNAYNSAFGEKNKILSKIVDVYSYDYNKQ